MLSRLENYLISQQKGKKYMDNSDQNGYDPDLIEVFNDYDGKTIKIPYRGYFIIVKISNFKVRKHIYNDMYVINDKSVHVIDTMINNPSNLKIRPLGTNLGKMFILIDKYIEKTSKKDDSNGKD